MVSLSQWKLDEWNFMSRFLSLRSKLNTWISGKIKSPSFFLYIPKITHLRCKLMFKVRNTFHSMIKWFLISKPNRLCSIVQDEGVKFHQLETFFSLCAPNWHTYLLMLFASVFCSPSAYQLFQRVCSRVTTSLWFPRT